MKTRKTRTARLTAIHASHPEQNAPVPSTVVIRLDTGLKTGQLTEVRLTVRDAIRWLHTFAEATNVAYQVTEQRRDRHELPEPERFERVGEGRNAHWREPS